MPPSIPDRWIPYKACGTVIEGTSIICFKVPLRRIVQQNNKEIKEIWDINTLLRTIPNLGIVIDLTNTSRYYNPLDLQKAGVLYKKIFMPGRIIPPEDRVLEFMDAVDEFSGKNCDAVIGVHCTHGLNRTGYMVCRYMRDRLGIDGKEAIKRFELARGYNIERENYIADIIGQAPPSPDLGKDTTLKPIDDGETSAACGLSNYKNVRNWHSRRHQSKYNSVGRYVKHPSRFSPEEGDSENNRNRNGTRFSRFSDSDRSDRSYDFRYDY